MADHDDLEGRAVSSVLFFQKLTQGSTFSGDDSNNLSLKGTGLGEPCSSGNAGTSKDGADFLGRKLENPVIPNNFYSEPAEEYGNQSSEQLKGILKSSKKYSGNERAVGDILNLLLTSTSSTSFNLQLHCAKYLFPNLCFDEFFQIGECLSSSCEQNHQYRTFIFNRDPSTVWTAALYVICQAPIPCIRAIKDLVHFFSKKSDLTKALALAKCIAKVKFADRLELADYMVNILSRLLGRRDIITRILILNFSELQANQFNELMEGLGVFEFNSAHFSDLMHFLNFRSHRISNECLLKLMKDAIQCYWPESSFIDSVAGFVGKLSPEDLLKLKPKFDDFLIEFGSITGPSKAPLIVEKLLGKKNRDSKKKRVKFNKTLQTVKMLESALPVIPSGAPAVTYQDQTEPATSSATTENVAPLQALDIELGERLVSVFGNTCLAWLVYGYCPKLVCSCRHDFPTDSLSHKKPEEVFVAVDFIVEQTVCPDIRVLEEFVSYLTLSTNEAKKVLMFKKCAPRMDRESSERLTALVLAQLQEYLNDPWEALELVMIPNLLDPVTDSDVEQFRFSARLLESIMSVAVDRKKTMCKYLKEEIMRRVTLLSSSDRESILEATSSFISKFLLDNENQQKQIPETFPVPATSKFSSSFKVSLFTGGQSKFFVGCTLLKFALGHNLTETAADDLYSFLLSQFARAQILRDMLDTTCYFTIKDRKSIRDLLGNVAVRLCIHFYENENLNSSAQIFLVLRKYKFNILDLQSQNSISGFDLAMMYCSLVVDFHYDETTIDTFLEHCLQTYLDKASSLGLVPNTLSKLVDKMFTVLCNACAINELFRLFSGIFTRQNSMVCPLNLIDYYEPTLRCTFCEPFEYKIWDMSLKLYADVVEAGVPVKCQKVTYRSLFIVTATRFHFQNDQKYSDPSKARSPDLFNPEIKKLLIKCMDEGVYPKIMAGDQITLFSSMSHEELKIYSLWWFCLFLRSKKRKRIGYFYRITVQIVQDICQDEWNLPIHFSLQAVDPSEAACASRLATVWSNMIDNFPPSMFRRVKHGVYELRPDAVASISEAVLNQMMDHNQIQIVSDPVSHLCSLCFDARNDIIVADKI